MKGASVYQDEMKEARGVDEFEISLFPIPGSVSLPGSKVPLHVFEPRYRSLIKDSVRLNRRVGVCHTKKVTHPAKPGQTQAETLNSNQASYEPCPIFSAGLAEIVEVTADGRLIVEIAMERRFQRLEDIQLIPYRVSRCRSYQDEEASPPDAVRLQALRAQIDLSLRLLSEKMKDGLAQFLESETWRRQTDVDYSFKVFQLFRFDPELMQMVLEIRSPEQRLRFLAQALGSSLTPLQ